MQFMLLSAARAFKSLPSGAMIKIAIISMLLNALVLAGLVAGIYALLSQFNWFGIWDSWFDAGATFISGLIAYFIYPLLLPLIISLFDTAIADAIERDEYPQLPAKTPPYWPTLLQDAKFVGKVILINIVVLPLYLLPFVNLFLYYIVNGYLLGTEFFNIVAGRHMTRAEATVLRKKYRGSLISIGVLITVSSTIPLLNLIAPMLGVIMMVHFFHALKPNYKITIESPNER
jgi:CysZ protein